MATKRQAGPAGVLAKKARQEEAEVEAPGQLLEDGARYTGRVKVVKGTYFAYEAELAQVMGADSEITELSGAPETIRMGDCIEFSVMDGSEAQDWSAPVAWNIVVTKATQKVVTTAAKQKGKGAGKVTPPTMAAMGNGNGLLKSGAVAAFKAAEAAGATFKSGKGAGKGKTTAGFMGAAARRKAAQKEFEPFEKAFVPATTDMSKSDQQVMQQLRTELEITVVQGEDACFFPPVCAFEEYEGILPKYVFDNLASQGIEAPMPIQSQALPLALAGMDMIGIAKTGSGKTLAYLLPALVHIEAQEAIEGASPIALILAPVRELAVQIGEEAAKIVQGSAGFGNHAEGLRACVAYGGGASNKGWQIREMQQGCHICAATPGRLVDLVDSGEVWLDRVSYFVLDEADRMLECGFGDQVQGIAGHIRPDRQTLFFSATWPEEVQQLAEAMCGGEVPPALVAVGQNALGNGPVTREDIVQEVVVFDDETWEERDNKKQELLYAHVRETCANAEHKVLVFVSRKDLADGLVNALWQNEGVEARAMHSGRGQDTRLLVLDEFKKGDIKLLVTTDVMARGLDIPNVSHVVCYDMGDIDDYVHRIGRTARGPYGQGHALTFFEYDRKWPDLAAKLIEVLESSSQEVPDELRRLASESENGERSKNGGKKQKWGQSWGQASWNQMMWWGW